MITPLPAGLQPYKRTKSFTEANIPQGLLKDHSTMEGCWGLIRVEEGQLRYVVTDPRRPAAEHVLTSDKKAMVVEPTILHRVEALGPVRFHVEFWRPGKRPGQDRNHVQAKLGRRETTRRCGA